MATICSIHQCEKGSLARSMCERHFLAQFVQPLQKERDRLEQTLDILNGNIKELLDELGSSRPRLRPNAGKGYDFLREINGRRVNEGALVYCHRCEKPFESGIECINHEEQCKGSRPPKAVKSVPAKQPRPAKADYEVVDNGSGMDIDI